MVFHIARFLFHSYFKFYVETVCRKEIDEQEPQNKGLRICYKLCLFVQIEYTCITACRMRDKARYHYGI